MKPWHKRRGIGRAWKPWNRVISYRQVPCRCSWSCRTNGISISRNITTPVFPWKPQAWESSWRRPRPIQRHHPGTGQGNQSGNRDTRYCAGEC